jgi:hypothetical protein
MPKKKVTSQWYSCLDCRRVHQVLPHRAMVASEIPTIRKQFLTGIAALVVGGSIRRHLLRSEVPEGYVQFERRLTMVSKLDPVNLIVIVEQSSYLGQLEALSYVTLHH